MSGGEPSSIKRTAVCAVRAPDLSRLLLCRAYRISRGRVCSLAKGRFVRFHTDHCEARKLYEALYRKYRPRTFDDVVGQEAVTETLKNQVRTGRLSHAYLFIGTRGTGKTTCARILAKAVNCEHPVDGNPCNSCASCRGIEDGTVLDVTELDAASNNGVEDVRLLRDEAIFSPTKVKKRVYIIDEVHMLSKPAFNALLKILEEPPEHLMFILATTELNKVLPTILSRCQRHSFRRLDASAVSGRLSYVAEREGIRLEKGAADLLGRLADGGMRDGLSLLDQCSGREIVDEKAVLDAMGLAGTLRTRELAEDLMRRDHLAALEHYGALWRDGKDPSGLLGELGGFFRDALLYRLAPGGGKDLLSGAYGEDALRSVTGSDARLLHILNTLQRHRASMFTAADPKLQGELCLLEICGFAGDAGTGPALAGNRDAALPRTERNGPAEEKEPARPEEKTPVSRAAAQAEREPDTPPPASDPGKAAVSESGKADGPADTGAGQLWQDVLRGIRPSVGIGEYVILCDPEKVSGEYSDGELVLYVQPGFETGLVTRSDMLQKIRECAADLAGRPVAVRAAEKKNSAAELNEDKLRALEKFGNVTFR